VKAITTTEDLAEKNVMKIGLGKYPLMQPAAGEIQKTLHDGAKKNPAGPVDLPVPSPLSDKVVVKHIKEIEAIARRVMDSVGDEAAYCDLSIVATGDRLEIGDKTAQLYRLKSGNIFMLFSVWSSCESDEGAASNDLIIVKDILFIDVGGVSGGFADEIPIDFSKDIALRLFGSDTGICTRTDGSNPLAEKKGFLISVGTGHDLTPIVSIIHRNRSGGTKLIGNELAVTDERTVVSIIRTLDFKQRGEERRTFLDKTARAAKIPCDSTGGQFNGGLAVLFADDGRIVKSRPGFNPVEKVKQIVSLIMSGSEGRQIPLKEEGDNSSTSMVESSAGFETTGPLEGTFPGPMVHVVNPGTGAFVRSVADTEKGLDVIVRRTISPPEVLDDLVPLDMEMRVTDSNGYGDTAIRILVKGTVKRATKNSLQMGSDAMRGETLLNEVSSLGMKTDGDGGLKLDSKVFRGAFPTDKDEVIRSGRDFAVSLQDRVAYSFNPFAGDNANGPQDAPLHGPQLKQGIENKHEDIKEAFEKRLNELQMLLKSSYELKESFMHRKFAGQDGQDEEEQ
jgi:hypothetical protein